MLLSGSTTTASPPQIDLQIDGAFDQSQAFSVSQRWRRAREGGFIVAKTLTLNLFAYTLMTNIHVRPTGRTPSQQAQRSWSRGVTTQAFAIAGAIASLSSNLPQRVRRPLVAVTQTLAATTALIRVAGGQEGLRDALLGAAIGSALGFFVPHLHRAHHTPGDRLLQTMQLGPAIFGGAVGINTSLRF